MKGLARPGAKAAVLGMMSTGSFIGPGGNGPIVPKLPCLYRRPLRKGSDISSDLLHPPILPSNRSLTPGPQEKASKK
jgi:hypothetical protein